VCVCVCVHAYMYVCMCVCIYVLHTHLFTHTHAGTLKWLQLSGSTHAEQLAGSWPPVMNPILKHRMGLLDRRIVAEAGLVDLMLLRESDYLIGQFSSAMSLMALELSAAEKGFVPPYIGLDGPWQSLVN
jgi:hypothetical protein